MPRKKIKRFAQLSRFANVYECNNPQRVDELKNKLSSSSKTILELACGKAEYTISLAKQNPDTLCVAMDIQGERLWVGASKAKEASLDNAIFIRGHINRLLDYIPAHCIDEIWLTFPDPFPRDKQAKKRLTTPYFLNLYKKVLKKDGILHLKTDSQLMYEFSKQTLKQQQWQILKDFSNIDRKLFKPKALKIKTYFENIHRAKGTTIKYLKTKVQ